MTRTVLKTPEQHVGWPIRAHRQTCAVRYSTAQKSLEGGEWLTGMFQPLGADFETAGVLQWDADNGAELRLADLSRPWPTDFDADLTIHGRLNVGERVTLLRSWLRSATVFDNAERFASNTLALGSHTDVDETWAYACYCPTSLHEWYGAHGFTHVRPDDEDGPPRVELRQMEPRRFAVAGADIDLELVGDWTMQYGPRWCVENEMEFVVRPDEPLTLDSYWRQFRSPLLGFMRFATDRPDDMRWEMFGNPDAQRRMVVLKSPRESYERPWRLTPGHFLFRADEIADEGEAIRKWFEVWRASEPSLGLFCESIQGGSAYSPSRFLTLFTGAEGYWNGTKRADEKNWGIDALVKRANIDERISKADQEARKLIGGLRRYHAHLSLPGNLTPDEVALSTFASTRRLHVLMQACLLRELGLETEQIELLIHAHYRGWPIA